MKIKLLQQIIFVLIQIQFILSFAKILNSNEIQKNMINKYNIYVSDALQLTNKDANFHFVAKHDIKTNETMIKIKQFISKDVLKKEFDCLYNSIGSYKNFNNDMLWLALYIAKENKTSSDTFDYYLNLIKQTKTTNNLIELKDLQALKAIPELYWRVERIQFIINDFYENINIAISKEKLISSFFLVFSRAFQFHNLNDTVLIPFGDYFNHESNAKSTFYYNETDQFIYIKTLQNYQKNQQIFINYGKKNNYDLLLQYGYIPENNEDHFILLPILDELLIDDANYDIKVKILGNEKDLKLYATGIERLDLLRVIALTPKEFSSLALHEILFKKSIPYSLNNEINCLKLIYKISTILYNRYDIDLIPDNNEMLKLLFKIDLKILKHSIDETSNILKTVL